MRNSVIHDAFIEAVQTAKSVFITAHVGPDGDTLGSMLAFKHAFEKACPHIHGVHCVIAGKMPDVYRFLPGIRDVKNIETDPEILDYYDLAISVDCGSADRFGPAERVFSAAGVSVNIDHHISNKQFGKININVPTAAASGEVVADLLTELKIPLDANIATCLYTALVTDTGGFKYSNATAKAFELAAKLVTAGADPEYIYKELYEKRPRAQALMQAEALSKTRFNEDYTLGWTLVDRAMLKKHGALEEYIDGLVESIRQMDTVVIAAVFKETPDGNTKISLRSDSHAIDVAAVMEPFDGGGHKMAAGCTMLMPLREAEATLIPILKDKIRQKISV
ncbi:MAG: bifunctional oligoribonuclease/PAP phosphatase NrnA [Cyanobacteria bacterium]|nr:bifunctional oligoribonuclease/PAP phosphatase NrnA [Cyanobacteriota bacterium]